VEAKKKKLEETQGRPNHRAAFCTSLFLKAVALARLGVPRKPNRIQFWNKSWREAVDTNRVRIAANVEEHRG
jgi:hypothetical protein